MAFTKHHLSLSPRIPNYTGPTVRVKIMLRQYRLHDILHAYALLEASGKSHHWVALFNMPVWKYCLTSEQPCPHVSNAK